MTIAGALLTPATATATAQSAAPEVGTADWRTVSVGGYHSCGIRLTGRLYCWGSDSKGQLGNGGANTDQPTPVQVAGGATNWTQVTAGDNHTCARRATGRLYCWGADGGGQLGDGGANLGQPTPTEVAGSLTDWTHVEAGGIHTCARRATKRLYCWGFDGNGRLGDGGANTSQPTPVEVEA